MPFKRIEEVGQTRNVNGNDKLLIVKTDDNNVTKSVTVDDFIHENSINTGEICDCAITDPKISNGAIKTRHMTADTIDGCVISTGTLDAGKITTGTLDANCVTISNLDAGCITTGTICADRIGAIDISACCLDANCITTGKICGDLIDGLTISADCITGLSITADDITSGTLDASCVTISNLDAGCITTGTICADRIGAIDISACCLDANCITTGKICGDLIDGLTISADCITGLSITANDITSGTLDACCVTISNLDASCITSGTICADRIGAIDISACTLDADCITSGTIDADRIGAIDISTCNLNANCITSGSICTDRLASGSIKTCHLAACSVDAGKIAANAVGATAIAAGSVAATALESNIIIAGSIQSSNFDGFNYVCGTTTGEEILQYLSAGEQGFFLDERTGTAVFTDIIARDNVIAANYIKYSDDSGLSAIDDNGNFGINLDTDFLSVEDGKVTITRIPSDTVVDSSLFLTPNTIFFGQSETQEFELPTINQNRNFFGTSSTDTSTWSLCAMTVRVPNLYATDNTYKFDYRLNNALYLYHSNDYRNVSIYNSEFVGDNVLPASSSLGDLDTTGIGATYDQNGSGVHCEHVILMIDLHELGITAAQVSGNITLNNLKIKWDTSKLNVLSLIKAFSFFDLQCYMSSTSAIHYDVSSIPIGVGGDSGLISRVTNPTVIGDVYEATVDISLGHPKTAVETAGNSQRFITLVIRYKSSNINLNDNTFPDYRGYLPLSAEFTTGTNLRFEATGAIPETKNYDLSSINHLIPGNQLVRARDHTLTKTTAHIPFEWSSDLQRQLGYPELNINSPLSGTVALNGGSPVRDILEEHGSWTAWSTHNGN